MLSLYTLLLVHIGVALALRTPRLLIYTATDGFRHDSIPTAIAALKSYSTDFVFDNTEDRTWFTDSRLSQYDALVFVSASGEVLDQAGKSAFQRYLNKGGNFIGVHCAATALVTSPFYVKELGARFDHHPRLSNWTVQVLDTTHPSTRNLPVPWSVTDEEYYFIDDPRKVGAVVILSVDDTPANNVNHGSPHPIAWYQEHGAGVQQNVTGSVAGRSFYTALGHRNQSWQDPTFMGHMIGGITWALQANTTKAFNDNALVGSDLPEISQWPTPPPSPPPEPSPASTTSVQGGSEPVAPQLQASSSSQRLMSGNTATVLSILMLLALSL